jgi:hypothetical protein
MIAALAAAAACALGACASFDDPSTVKDLRVLAVAAEPSEIILMPADPSSTTPPPIPPITLSPLVADPNGGGRAITVTVTACANDPGAPAPPGNTGDPTRSPAGGPRTTVGSALCDGAPTEIAIADEVALAQDGGGGAAGTAAIVAQLTPAWIADAFTRDVFPGPDGKIHGGFDLGMPVVFQLRVRAGDREIDAIKRVIFWSHPIDDAQRANTTPVIGGVTAYDRRDPTTAEPLPDAVVPLDQGTPLAVPEDGLWIDPAPAAAESYETVVLDRVTGTPTPDTIPRETLTYQFFATAGTFSPFETSSEPPPGVTVTRVHIESKYHPPPPKDRPDGAAVTIWIVVRDDRGGVSWLQRSLDAPPPP